MDNLAKDLSPKGIMRNARACTRRSTPGCASWHFHKPRPSCFPLSFFPVDKLGSSKFPIAAKCRYTLPALLLLGNQIQHLAQACSLR
jgi:hypothetical protein